MGGLPFRPENSVPDPWDVLHQGSDREELDSPAHFTLDRAAVLMRVRSLHGVQRQPRRPPEPPVPGGVTPPPAPVSAQPPSPQSSTAQSSTAQPSPVRPSQPAAPPLVPPSQTSGYIAPGPPPPEYAPPQRPAQQGPPRENEMPQEFSRWYEQRDYRPARPSGEFKRPRRQAPRQSFAPQHGVLPEPEEVYPTGRHTAPSLPVVPPEPPRPSPAVEERARASASRTRTLMRPYAHTRGRTRPDYELALETLVSTSLRGRRYEGAVSVQQRRICALCTEPRSVAEIAAYLHLPLNVVKVLVSDMDNVELVMLHQPGLSFGDRSSRQFMERVLEGLRSL